jgi:hypothetical protein
MMFRERAAPKTGVREPAHDASLPHEEKVTLRVHPFIISSRWPGSS